MLKKSALIFLTVFLVACSKEEAVEVKPSVSAGELVVNKNCKVCHAQGINGAPIIGNKKMWGPRVAQGEATLVQHAMEGFGLMPAKAGKPDLTEEEITLAVQYFISKVQ